MTEDATITDILKRLDSLEQVVAAMTSSQTDTKEPPLPPKLSRKFEGEKIDIRARIDSVLYSLLTSDAHKQSGGNISRQLDTILWRYYGQPKLSFELKAGDG